MSTKHVRTPADLVRFKCALQVSCGSCGNIRTLDGFEVARTCGTKSLASIRPRLKCARCGAKAAALAILSPPPPR